MAVGVIIGGAFTSIVTAVTDNLINPILYFVTGAESYGLKDIAGFGSNLVSSIVNFLIMAFILFCILKAFNLAVDLGKKKLVEEEAKAPTTKVCPYCKSEIPIEATRCPHCTSVLEETKAEA